MRKEKLREFVAGLSALVEALPDSATVDVEVSWGELELNPLQGWRQSKPDSNAFKIEIDIKGNSKDPLSIPESLLSGLHALNA